MYGFPFTSFAAELMPLFLKLSISMSQSRPLMYGMISIFFAVSSRVISENPSLAGKYSG